jgi:DNA-binding transcriptional ArsR family regulator
LEFVARAGDPARYDGKRWSPNSNGPSPVTFEELTQEFLDPLFVSAALDELLDAGLLKASDQELRIGGLEFSRAFEAGGEYNAIRVSRMADALRSVSVPIAADVVRTESRELWYTN